MTKIKLNKDLYDTQMKLKEQEWNSFLQNNINNHLLEKASELPSYYREYASAELVAVIKALPAVAPNANSYYSCPNIIGDIQNKNLELPRLAPAFLFDNSKILKYMEKSFLS